MTSFHFFKKSNSLRLNISVSVKDALDLLKYSISDASDYLLMALFAVFMNKAISVFFGESFLILASVIIMITDFQSLFDGIGDALTPVVYGKCGGFSLTHRTGSLFRQKPKRLGLQMFY